jgi:hypothetical protein
LGTLLAFVLSGIILLEKAISVRSLFLVHLKGHISGKLDAGGLPELIIIIRINKEAKLWISSNGIPLGKWKTCLTGTPNL